MNENNISRRRMIKVSSVAALSTLVSPSLVSANHSVKYSNEKNFEIVKTDSEICYMNAVDLAERMGYPWVSKS